jgi:energy-converting hydrogenase Eha subunit C
MVQQTEIAKEVLNEGLSGITEYVLPIVAVLSLMAIFGFRIVLFSGNEFKNNKYIYYSILVTFVLICMGVVLKYIDEHIAEPIISAVSTIIFVLFMVQLIIQIKLRKK